ncbi:MAG: iron ABC transporter permease [Deltaproteobacteria bacterium]|nr:iron ABC transporter permease [Deltaproteobacteria bacterium]
MSGTDDRGPRRMSASGFFVAVSLLLAVSIPIALSLGSVSIGLDEVTRALIAGSDSPSSTIIRELRLPRILLAILVGGALATAGTTLQSVMKSPLADPYILGISSGAGVGAALATAMSLGRLTGASLAFVTGLGSAFAVLALSRVGGRIAPLRLLLAGIAWSSLASSVTAFVLFLAPRAEEVRAVFFYLLGGLAAASWTDVGLAAVASLAGLLVAWSTWRWQNLLAFGDEPAQSLGVDPARARITLVVAASLVTGVIVSVVGAIGFVGLVVPHVVRAFVGPDHRRTIPLGFLAGGLLIVWMDTLARTLLAPRELPVGVLTGLLGAPFFLSLLARGRIGGSS